MCHEEDKILSQIIQEFLPTKLNKFYWENWQKSPNQKLQADMYKILTPVSWKPFNHHNEQKRKLGNPKGIKGARDSQV